VAAHRRVLRRAAVASGTVVAVIELDFACLGAHTDLAAAGPTIALRLRITESTGTPVYAVALRCQLRVEPWKRRYDDTEAEALQDLFGERSRWGDTLKPMQLGYLNQVVPSFTRETEIELPLAVSYDVDVAAHKYFYGLTDGEAPLLLLFSGTVFTVGDNGVAVEPVPWHKEATFRLPIAVWQQTMELHFPGTAWLRLRRDSFDAVQRYRAREQLLSIDDAVQKLLKEAGES
jgi:hypothetical protein